MKPQDIRVGNLIANNGKILKAEAQDILDISRGSVLYQGIPLTPKRAERFGFIEKVPGRWMLSHFHQFELAKENFGNPSFKAVRYIGEHRHFMVRTSVPFVHDLQNMYFGFEGMDLNWK